MKAGRALQWALLVVMYTQSRSVVIPTTNTLRTPLGISGDAIAWSIQPTGGSPNAIRYGGLADRVLGGLSGAAQRGIYTGGIVTCGAAYLGDPCPGVDIGVSSEGSSTTVSVVETVAERGDLEYELRHDRALRERLWGRKVA